MEENNVALQSCQLLWDKVGLKAKTAFRSFQSAPQQKFCCSANVRGGLLHSAVVPVGGLGSATVLLAQQLPDFFDHWPTFPLLACRISACYHALKAFPSSIICSVAGETDLGSDTFFCLCSSSEYCVLSVIVLSVGTVHYCV